MQNEAGGVHLFIQQADHAGQSLARPLPQRTSGSPGTPIPFHILGGSEFRLRQGFATQNAWAPHWRRGRAGWRLLCCKNGAYLSSRQTTPGRALPSMNSRLAPPPVEMWVILSA